MKSTIIIMLFLFSGISMSAQEVAKGNSAAPQFKFVTEVMDYGTIEKSSNGIREFKFTNTGKEAIIIQNVNSSCGCLVATWPKEPIKPGASSVIKATYDTERVGRFEKTLTIISNADRQNLVLKIKGEVLPSKTAAEPVFPK